MAESMSFPEIRGAPAAPGPLPFLRGREATTAGAGLAVPSRTRPRDLIVKREDPCRNKP